MTDCDNLETVLKAVADKNLITDNTPSIDIFDLDYFRARCVYTRTSSKFNEKNV